MYSSQLHYYQFDKECIQHTESDITFNYMQVEVKCKIK